MEEITEIVDWYSELKPDFMDINTLMLKRDRLAGYFYTLSTLVGQSRGEHKLADVRLDYKKAQKQVQYSKKGSNNASAIARANTHVEAEIAAQKDGDYKTIELQWKAVSKVLDAMSQRIAKMRVEFGNEQSFVNINKALAEMRMELKKLKNR